MVSTTASGTYPYRKTALFWIPESAYFTAIKPYFYNVILRFVNRTYELKQ